MARGLNPSLFEDRQPNNQSTTKTLRDNERELQATESILLTQQLADKVEFLTRKIREMESDLTNTNTRIERVQENLTKRLEFIQNANRQYEEQVQYSFQEFKGKLSLLIGKIKEKRVSEVKVQELVDRHNQIVQKFDLRLTQLKKVISDQEMQILSCQSILKQHQLDLRPISKR